MTMQKTVLSGWAIGAVLSVAVCAVTAPSTSEARGFGGVARGGPAAGGTVRTRPASRPTASRRSPGSRGSSRGDARDVRRERRDDVRDVKKERHDDVRDVRKERYEHRRDHRKERHEWYEDRWKRRTIGGALTIATFSSLSCKSTTILVGGVTYYRCGNDWYQRAYRSTEVVYIVVQKPSGY